jgi:hypothetical protein
VGLKGSPEDDFRKNISMLLESSYIKRLWKGWCGISWLQKNVTEKNLKTNVKFEELKKN